jgi:hypothetical protein
MSEDLGWVATTKDPVAAGDELENLKPPEGLTSLKKAERAQYDAALEAVPSLLAGLEGKCHVALSGHQGKPQINIMVVQVPDE